jgi:uncharacterized membrane protein (DUF373 family)
MTSGGGYNEDVVIVEDKLRERSSQCFHFVEAALYIAVGALLSVVAAAIAIQVVGSLWQSLGSKGAGNYALIVLDQLLLILMLVELLHTVRISVRSQTLVVEPFLIVGLIACIRRILVITMQAAKITEQAAPQAGEAADAAFRNTIIELGLLGFLVLVFVFTIFLLRRSLPRGERHSPREEIVAT